MTSGSPSACAASPRATRTRSTPAHGWPVESYAEALNDMDEVVGYRYPQASARAFFWSSDQGRIDLPSVGASRAYDVNNDGTVVGDDVAAAVVWHVRPQVTEPPRPPRPPTSAPSPPPRLPTASPTS